MARLWNLNLISSFQLVVQLTFVENQLRMVIVPATWKCTVLPWGAQYSFNKIEDGKCPISDRNYYKNGVGGSRHW